MAVSRILALSLGVLVVSAASGVRADFALIGPTNNKGVYTSQSLADFSATKTLYSFGGVTGVALWDLLGGPAANVSPGGMSATWGAMTFTTPPGGAPNNAILRHYVLATGAGGDRSVVSLGEIAPVLGGVATAALPAFVAFKVDNASNTLLATPQLVIPGAGEPRSIDDLKSLSLQGVPALPAVDGRPLSTSVTLTGDVPTNSGTSYDLADLIALAGTLGGPKSVTTTSGNPPTSNTYKGINLFDFIDPNTTDWFDKLVITKATDGYQVVNSLAELVTSLGGNPLNLLAYDDTGGQLNPGSADIARTIFPGDTMRAGRFMSNLYEIAVLDAPNPVPLPGAWIMMLTGLAGLGVAKFRRARKVPEEAVAA